MFFEDGALLVVHDHAFGIAIGQPRDFAPGPSVGDFLDGEVEFVAGDEIDRRRRFQAAGRIDRDFGADKSGLERRVHRFERLDGFDVGSE
jgi:hypothetical protein